MSVKRFGMNVSNKPHEWSPDCRGTCDQYVEGVHYTVAEARIRELEAALLKIIAALDDDSHSYASVVNAVLEVEASGVLTAPENGDEQGIDDESDAEKAMNVYAARRLDDLAQTSYGRGAACECDDAAAILCSQNKKTNTVGCQCKCHTSDRTEDRRTPPYPWCRQPSVCRGTCPMDPSCGE